MIRKHQPRFARPLRALLGATASAAMALGLACAASPASAQLLGGSPQITEYPMPTVASGSCEIEFDRNGFAWIEEVTGSAISRYDPRTNTFVRFPLPQALTLPGGMEIGPDGALWFPQMAAGLITRLDTSDGSMQSFPIPFAQLNLAGLNVGLSVASDITSGKDGAMWFSMSGYSAIGRIDLVTKQIELISLPTPFATTSLVTQIVQPGPGNTIVISLGVANKLATIDVFTRQITEYTVPTPAALPQGVTTDKNGDIWFTETGSQKFGRLNVSTGQFTEWNMLALRGLSTVGLTLGNPLPFPGPIRFGSDGKLYMAEGGLVGGNKIARFDTATGAFTEFVLPTPAGGPCDINNSQTGALWFGEFTGNRIGKIKF